MHGIPLAILKPVRPMPQDSIGQNEWPERVARTVARTSGQNGDQNGNPDSDQNGHHSGSARGG